MCIRDRARPVRQRKENRSAAAKAKGRLPVSAAVSYTHLAVSKRQAQQIAALAGVSRGTVDRALHNRGRVNPEVAAKIHKIAAE